MEKPQNGYYGKLRPQNLLPLALVLVLLIGGGIFMITMPGHSFAGKLEPLTDSEKTIATRLRQHIEKLAIEIGERSVRRPGTLPATADYLVALLKELGYTVTTQEVKTAGQSLHNVEAELQGSNRRNEIVVVGAHYDSVTGCPGANDNGTGVASALEIARLLVAQKPSRTLRFVFFVNEEPPYFQTDEMGSYCYAGHCKSRGDNIAGMLSLETIGYYSDAKGSQDYPFPFSLMYPDTGNFIGFVADLKSRKFLCDCISSFRNHTKFPSEGISAPDFIPGIGWSDQWAFWHYGYPAIMITDTAPYRYPFYHTPGDTADKIDYDRTARVTAGLARVVEDLSQ